VLNVWVRDRDGGEAVPVTDDRDRGIRSYLWSRDSRRILYSQDVGGDENHHLLAVDADGGGTARDLTPFPGVRAGLIDAPRATPRHVLVSMNLRDRSLFDAYRLTLATGRLELVGRNPGNIIGWTADREGRLRAAWAQTPAGDYEILVRGDESGELRVVAEYANEDGGHPFAFTPDGARLWVGSARGSDLLRLVELDPADGAEREIDRDDEVDLSGPVVSDRTGELLGRSTCATGWCCTPSTSASPATGSGCGRCTRATRASAARTPTRRRSSSPSTTTATPERPTCSTARPARRSSSTAPARGSIPRRWPRCGPW
jgi:hypothetical protein